MERQQSWYASAKVHRGLAAFIFILCSAGVYGAFKVRSIVYENSHLQKQMAKVHAHIATIEASMAKIRTYRDNIEDLARTPLESPSASDRLRTNVSRFVKSYEERSLLEADHLPIETRLEMMSRNTVQVERMLRTLATVLGHSRAFLGAIPSITPTSGWVSSNFGKRYSPFTGERVMHRGLDIGAEKGSSVVATADGQVLFAGRSLTFGNLVIIGHQFNIVTKYAHNSKLLVKTGDQVKRGDVISLVGSTGRSTGPHLHYEVWVNSHAVDPSDYLLDRPGNGMLLAENLGSADTADDRPLLQVGGEELTDVEPDTAGVYQEEIPQLVQDQVRAETPVVEPFNWRRSVGYSMVSLAGLLALISLAHALLKKYDDRKAQNQWLVA